MKIFHITFVASDFYSIEKVRPAILIDRHIAVPLSSQIENEGLILNRMTFGNTRPSKVVVEQTQFIQPEQIVSFVADLDKNTSNEIQSALLSHFKVKSLNDLKMILVKS